MASTELTSDAANGVRAPGSGPSATRRTRDSVPQLILHRYGVVTSLEPAVTERTKAIIPVHLYGQACDMGPIMAVARKYDLKVLEDVAQTIGGDYKGSKFGSVGHAGTFSFFPSKDLGGFHCCMRLRPERAFSRRWHGI